MELVNAALTQKGLKFSDLPADLKGKLKKFEEYIEKYNEACDVYDEKDEDDPEMVRQLDESENYIVTTDAALAEEIKNYQPAPAPKTQEELEAERLAAEAAKKKEKKGSGIGWVIGGVILTVVTLGVVNGFGRKGE
jgi:DNA repair exonuclease SbcCD ATPase subunit